MKRSIAAVCAIAAALVATPALASSPHITTATPPPLTTIGTPGDYAVAHFTSHLSGTSRWDQSGAGSLGVQIYGQYRGLNPNLSYFTVIYGNKNCDPAQAFPVGPFYPDSRGRATLAAAQTLPATVDLGMTGSMSVRRGDDQTDIDGDGLLGPTDVVAVPGNPSIGLIECDSHPNLLNLN